MIDGLRAELPLQGRKVELARILAASETFGGMSIKGRPGVGRTRLMTEAVRLLSARGWHPYRVMTVPPPERSKRVTEATDADRRLRLTLAAAARTERRTLLVVDDSHFLTEATTEILVQHVGSRNLFILLTISSGRRRTPIIDRLWKDGLLDRLDLEPVEAVESAALITKTLVANAPVDLTHRNISGTDPSYAVDGAAVHAITALSAGNLVVLRELTASAVERGVLTLHRDLWRLSGELPLSQRIQDVAWAHVDEVIALSDYAQSADIRSALDIIAIADSLLLSAASTLIDPALLEDLETTGLLAVRSTQKIDRVEFASPIIGRVIDEAIRKLRRRRLSGSIADALDVAAPGNISGAREQVLAARLHLAAGHELDVQQAVDAARLSWRFYPPDVTRQLADAADAAGGGFDAQLILATAEGQLGLADQAQQRLTALMGTADNDLRKVSAVSACADNLVLQLTDTDTAMALSQLTELQISDPEMRKQLHARRGLMMHAIGDTAGALELLEPLMDELDGSTLISACFAVAAGATMIGRLSTAESALARVATQWDAPGQIPPDPYSTLLDLTRCLTMGFSGDVAGAITLALFRYRQAVVNYSPLQQSWFAWAHGGLLLTQGYAADSVKWISEAFELSTELGQGSMRGLVRNDLVRALALSGRLAEADDLIESERLTHTDASDLFGARGARLVALGWVEAVRGYLPAARRQLRAAADAHAANDHNLPALHAYVDAARCGAAADILPAVERIAGIVEGDLSVVQVRIVRALAKTPAADVLLELAADTEKMGLPLQAAELFLLAAPALERLGETKYAASATRRAHVLSAECGSPVTPLLKQTQGPNLSAREREIATLAARGLTNKDIAARLVLSTRTVETHLNRAFGKLGIGNRGELTELRGSLLD